MRLPKGRDSVPGIQRGDHPVLNDPPCATELSPRLPGLFHLGEDRRAPRPIRCRTEAPGACETAWRVRTAKGIPPGGSPPGGAALVVRVTRRPGARLGAFPSVPGRWCSGRGEASGVPTARRCWRRGRPGAPAARAGGSDRRRSAGGATLPGVPPRDSGSVGDRAGPGIEGRSRRSRRRRSACDGAFAARCPRSAPTQPGGKVDSEEMQDDHDATTADGR